MVLLLVLGQKSPLPEHDINTSLAMRENAVEDDDGPALFHFIHFASTQWLLISFPPKTPKMHPKKPCRISLAFCVCVHDHLVFLPIANIQIPILIHWLAKMKVQMLLVIFSILKVVAAVTALRVTEKSIDGGSLSFYERVTIVQ